MPTEAMDPDSCCEITFNVSIQWVKDDCKEPVRYMADHYLEMVFAGRGAN